MGFFVCLFGIVVGYVWVERRSSCMMTEKCKWKQYGKKLVLNESGMMTGKEALKGKRSDFSPFWGLLKAFLVKYFYLRWLIDPSKVPYMGHF